MKKITILTTALAICMLSMTAYAGGKHSNMSTERMCE